MDANTSDLAGVGTGETAAEVAAKCSGMMVARRTTQNVGMALNGDPTAPSTPRAKHVRSEAQREGGYVGYEGILALAFADQDDGVPTELVVADFEYAIAAIRARAPKLRIDRPLGAYQGAEMKVEHQLNVVQRALDVSPDNPETAATVARVGRGYLAVLRDLIAYCDHRSVVLRGTPRRVYGARPLETRNRQRVGR